MTELNAKNAPRGLRLTPNGRTFTWDVHVQDYLYVRIRATIFDPGPVEVGHAWEVVCESMKQVISSLARGRRQGAVGVHIGNPQAGWRYDGTWVIIDSRED